MHVTNASSESDARRKNLLLVGAHGVIGRAMTEHFVGLEPWSLTTAARRGAVTGLDVRGGTPPSALSVDLLDPRAATARLAEARSTTHLVYAAYVERPTMAETVAPNVAMLANTLDGLAQAGAPLEHVVLVGGGKSYGEHLGPYKTPAKESDPRFLGPIFYNDQEDLLLDRAAKYGFKWTVLRPDAVIGFSVQSPMNLLMSIAVYAAISKDAGVPLRFPGKHGTWSALHQITDAGLFARAAEWALTSPAAAGQIFNVTNGDLFRWQHLWPEIAAFFDMPAAPPQPMSLVDQMADKEPRWNQLVARHGLVPTPWSQVASWGFADAVFGMEFDLVQSTIKIRKAGFHGAEDSHESVLAHLARLRREKYIP
ncbi:SDR family oxidoreductase [Pendulispora albinea]|uniref:SDR family oxidoreductase n=1 Tax=Pendulispora albinea TaxID=2741071 RepID=A0ABZ2M6H1_9BACT